jgi:hypothetical protein
MIDVNSPAAQRVDWLFDLHSQLTRITSGGHTFSVSTDDHCVLLEMDDVDDGERKAWLTDAEARGLAEALIKAVGWLDDEDAATEQLLAEWDAC